MEKLGPTVVTDDDQDEHYLIVKAMEKIGCSSEIVFLPDAAEALSYCAVPDIHPFLVMSDLNMPGMDGMELRQIIFHDAALSVQGFFIKPASFEKLEQMLGAIVHYWQSCASPQ